MRRALTTAAVLTALILPWLLSRSAQNVLVFACLYAIAALGVGLLMRTCGIFNVGQAFFYGVGAYSSALLSSGLGAPWPIGILAGAMLSGAIALLLGWPILRLTGYFLALATLALTIIGNALFYEWDWLTGGTLGIGGIPKIAVANVVFDTPLKFYYLSFLVLAASLYLANNLIRSRTGLMLRGLRDSAEAAASLSIDARRLRTQMFVFSAMLGSLSGSLLAHYGSFVNVESFDVAKSIVFLLIPVLGGTKSLIGVLVGAIFVTFMPDVLSSFGQLHQVLFGVALVVVVTLMPDGIMGFVDKRLTWARLRPH